MRRAIVLATIMILTVWTSATSLAAPIVPEVMVPNLAPAYVGTDYTVTLRVGGLSSARLVLYLGTTQTAEIPLVARGLGGIVSAHIPGSLFVSPGQLKFVVVGLDSSHISRQHGPYYLEVLAVPASANTGDDEIGVQATGPSRWFYDVENHGNIVNGVNISNIASQIKSPARYDPATERWPGLTNAHNQARPGDLTNPHRGLDIDIRYNEDVYAVLGGKVTLADPAAYSVLTQHDLDGNGSIDMYIRYEHVNPQVSSGQTITTSTVIGRPTQTDNHLHLRFDDPSFLSMPQYLFWKDSPWANGLDVDFIKTPTVSGTATVTAKIYGWNVVNYQIVKVYGENVKLYHRRWNTTTFTATSMTNPSGDQVTWVANIAPYYRSGDLVEYYVQAERKGLNEPNKKVFRPVYYNLYKDASGTWVATPPAEYFTLDIL